MADEVIPQRLSELAGERILEAVPNLEVRHPFDPDASGACFTLDGRTYLVFEDPSDGYRSTASPLMSFAGSAYELGGNWFATYIHEPVLCSHRTIAEFGGEDDVLEMRSKETGALIFAIGTSNVDDYYPSFTAEWTPQNLSANAKTRAHD